MALPEETPPTVDASGNTLTNGPNKPIPSWERAWSTDEMRRHCNNWSLAGDSALLHYLQEFSHKMILRTHEIEQLVNNLDQETKVANSKVSNTINDFHMLSSTQFVESRVYDEEVQDEVQNTKKLEEQKTKEQKEAEIVSKISQALEFGLSVMDQAFERVEIQQDSDSEDDSVLQAEVILEPKDPYIHRSLPYLIGSELFHRDDYVGLSDVLSEEEEKLEKESESEISTESESESDASPEVRKRKPPKRVHKDSENESDGSDLFPEGERAEFQSRSSTTSSMSGIKSDGANEDNVSDGVDGAPPRLLSEELDARLKQHINKKKNRKDSRRGSESASIRSSKASQKLKDEKPELKKAISDEDLFGPPSIGEEEDSLFSRKGGLFSGGGKLFDSEKKEEGLFEDIKKMEPKIEEKENSDIISPISRGRTLSGRKIPAGGISVFGGKNVINSEAIQRRSSIKSISDVSLPEEPEVNKTDSNKPTQLLKTGGLFDDSDEEDLFSSARKSTVSSVKDSKLPEKKSTLFAGDEDDGFFEKSQNKQPVVTEKKKPVGGVSMFGGLGGELNAKIRAQRPPSESDSDEKSDSLSRTGSRASSSSKSSLQTGKVTSGVKESRSNSSNSLFMEDPDADDMFITLKKDSNPETKSGGKNLLFGGTDDLLFSSKKKNEVTSPSDSKNADFLFDSVEEDDDIFKAISKPAVKKSSGSISLFADEEIIPVVTNETASEPKQLEVTKVVPQQPLPVPVARRTTVSLFDDDDGDDLFSAPSKKTPSTVNASDEVDSSKMKSGAETKIVLPQDKSKAKNLFDEDDLLFGGPASENPEVDLFYSKKEQVSGASSDNIKATVTESGKQVEASPEIVPNFRKPVGGVSLFGGVDLFSGRSSLKHNENSVKEEILHQTEENLQQEPVMPSLKMQRRAPMLTETRELSLSFDDPVDTSNTLGNACKDRVRVLNRRRPPSRKFRRQNSKDAIPEVHNSTPTTLQNGPSSTNNVSVHEVPTPVQEVPTPLESPDEQFVFTESLDITSPSTEEEDLFSVDEPIKLHGDTDLFAFHDTKTPSSRNKERDSKTRTDNIFTLPPSSNDAPPEKDLFAGASMLDKKLTADIFEDTEDDIFGSSSLKSGEGQRDDKESRVNASQIHTPSQDEVQAPKPTLRKNLDLFNDDDDIFASVPSHSTESTKKRISHAPSLFNDDDDDDIFAPKSVIKAQSTTKRKESITKKVTVKKQTNSVDAFDDPLLSAQKNSAD